ncbi:hypothetical protein [Cellulosilyticum sp. I15G10I2]|uniref:hypothetical protein n=1 Tax=Cellulosilyticum sp. I15G10I2 TaxID=1892843 RepID=UPI00085C3296|nr:hypothetical protein [Cellulosilyticum sp. I15G10I2]
MGRKNKSNALNYHQIYRILLLSFIAFFLFILINFFLPVANYISVYLLFLSLIFLGIHFYTKKFGSLITSLVLCICSLVVILAFLYLK